ncbi:MAG: helix-turn-helix domain-containing protein [Marinifilaceae bacterium]
MHDVISQNQRIEQLITNSETKLTDTEIFNKLTICLVQNKFILHPHLSIYDLCTELNVNRIRLTSIIQEHHNLSFAAYINKLRIDYACECLKRKPNTTIDNLFAQCGFNSIASFYRAFKANKQCSPKQWLSTNCYQCEVNE